MPALSIEQIPLLSSLNKDDLQELTKVAHRTNLEPGALLFREGEPGDSACIVLDGQVEIVKALGTSEERLIRVQDSGVIVGEMALLDPQGLRSATVRARTAVEVASLSRSDFDDLMQRRPSLVLELMRTLTVRLRESDNAIISDLRVKNRELEQAYLALQAAQAQIVQKEKLEHELQLAREVQQSILPRELPVLPGYDFGALMQPARAVGGDFFDFVPLGHDDLGIVVADVSDKGMPAAIFMALTRSLMRAEVARGVFPAAVLRRVNEHLLSMNQGSLFVTVLYGILHGRTGEFMYARAGHELPLILDAHGKVTQTPSSLGQMLGVFNNPALDEQVVTLPKGGKLLLFTDGVTDAVTADMALFGTDRLVQTVRLLGAMPAQSLCQGILEAVTAYQGPAPQFDDFTLVAVQA